MTLGKYGLRERVALIAKKTRMLIGTLIMVIVIVIGATACTFIGADNEDKAVDEASESNSNMADSMAEAPLTDRLLYEQENAIRTAILDYEIPRHSNGEYATEAHKILDESRDDNSLTVYLQVLYQTYSYIDGAMENKGGSSHPVAITFDIDSYETIEYWEPTAGEGYTSSIKKKFPSGVSVDDRAIVDELEKECNNDAVEYLKTRQSEEELLDEVVRNGGRVNDPFSSQLDPYDMLLAREDATLRYIYQECYKGGQTDERSKYMMSILSQILGGEALKLEAATLQEYFDAFVDYAERILEANEPDEIEKYYPKTYLLLEIGGKIK